MSEVELVDMQKLLLLEAWGKSQALMARRFNRGAKTGPNSLFPGSTQHHTMLIVCNTYCPYKSSTINPFLWQPKH